MTKNNTFVHAISNGVKDIPDISPRIFAILAILLALLGGFFAFAILEREYGRQGSLRILSDGSPVRSSTELESLEGPVVIKGKYLSSRSGGFYYLPTCSGAKRIKEKNMIWFESKEAAEAHGLKPATNCPGI